MKGLVPILVALGTLLPALPARPDSERGSNELHPSWSPDGGALVLRSDRSGNDDIWVLELGSGRSRRVTDDPGDGGQPAWSPTGGDVRSLTADWRRER